MTQYLFFDNASTTPCCSEAVELVRRFADEDYGNPSSSHAMGQKAAKAIRDSRLYFAKAFNVAPEQIIFTGSGSESDNLAVYGIAMAALARTKGAFGGTAPRVLVSAIEHPAVRKTAQSLSALGIDVQLIPVDGEGQIQREKYIELLTPSTILVSIHRVNNIVGAVLPVDELALLAKSKVPGVIFHTDAVQAFGRVDVPRSPSPVDLVSISGHKVQGPKGVGALIVLNKQLLKNGLRPLIWGGEQEGGFRSGTQSAGLIAGFQAASQKTLETMQAYREHVTKLRDRFRQNLDRKKLTYVWNSPAAAVPHIVSLSFPGFPSGPLARLLEERGCLVSTGSACSSGKTDPDPVLTAMGAPMNVRTSAIRVSFSQENSLEDVDRLCNAIEDSYQQMVRLLSGNLA